VASALPIIGWDGRSGGGQSVVVSYNDWIDQPYWMRVPNWSVPYGQALPGMLFYNTTTNQFVAAVLIGGARTWVTLAYYTPTPTPTFTPTATPTP